MSETNEQLIAKIQRCNEQLRKEPLVRETLQLAAKQYKDLAALTAAYDGPEGSVNPAKGITVAAALHLAFLIHTLRMMDPSENLGGTMTDDLERLEIPRHLIPLVLTGILFWKTAQNKMHEHPMFNMSLHLACSRE